MSALLGGVLGVAGAPCLGGCVGASAERPSDACPGARWTPGLVEIHHLALGQADATLIVGPTGRSLLVDVGEERWGADAGARQVGALIEGVLGCRHIDTVLLTHFHLDHTGVVGVGGLWHLIERQGFTVGRTLHRDVFGQLGRAGAVAEGWAGYLAGAGAIRLNASVARVGTLVDLGPGVRFRVVGADGSPGLIGGRHDDDDFPPNEDDYSLAAVLRFGAFDYFIGGDLSGHHAQGPAGAVATGSDGYAYHDVERHVARLVGDVDVYRINHHGSAHASSSTLMAQLAPRVAVLSVGDGNPFGHPHTAAVERITRTAAHARLYATARGNPRTRLGDDARVVGDVVVRTDGVGFDVAGDRFRAMDPRRTDADGDGYFVEADPDDRNPAVVPAAFGGCDEAYERCP